MSIQKTVNRYMNQPDKVRSCAFKKRMTKKEADVIASERNIKAYKCRHCPAWHVGHSRSLGRLMEPRSSCPKGCQRQIRASRLEKHLNKCTGIPHEQFHT